MVRRRLKMPIEKKKKLEIPTEDKPKRKLHIPTEDPPPKEPPKRKLHMPYVSIGAPTYPYNEVTKPLPKVRTLTKLKGLVICPVEMAWPDPKWPNWKINLEIITHAVVLDGEIITAAYCKKAAVEWAIRVSEITGKKIEYVGL